MTQMNPFINENIRRIVVFGDVHGDLELVQTLFKNSHTVIFDDQGNPTWIGGDTHVIQLGDQVDRCRIDCKNPQATLEDEHSDIIILELFNTLNTLASEHGGRVISLLGNHELINVEGNLSYVSFKGINEFEYDGKKGIDARISAFKPGGKYALLLANTRLPFIIVNDIFFSHAGMIDSYLDINNIKSRSDLLIICKKIRKFLKGQISITSMSTIFNDNSPFWTRKIGKMYEDQSTTIKCHNMIHKTLTTLKVTNIVVGHTPQSFKNQTINSVCNGVVWKIDVASSKAFGSNENQSYQYRRPQYLEILNGNTFIPH